MSEPSLLATKFTIPPLRAQLLPRAALIEHLNQSYALPLVLLSASAGFGKTTLLSAWASQCPHPVAWLTLDRLDNDSLRFWSAVMAALRTRLPTVGEEAFACLHSPQPPQLLTVLTALINDLATSGQEIVLILDDYHLIEEPGIHSSLQFLLDHTPSCLHLILSSRVDPPLSLSRLRARGQMAELRDTDLRVSEQEGALFLRQIMGLHLSAEDELRLARRTEGWLVGLQLAALSLSRQADPSAWIAAFSGSQRFILDYVQEEILACQPLAIQRFLMHTSVLNRMRAALCQAVTGEPASQALLETLERANLFLVPLDEERSWYRWHDLFREAMLARLHTVQPEMVPVLHQRAAHWYEAQQEWHEAISHWLSAADFSSAARLMELTAEQFSLRGEATTLSRWVRELPDAVVRQYAPLVLTVALYLIGETTPTVDGQHTRAHQEAEQLMARVEMALLPHENGTRPSTDGALPGAGFAREETGLAAEEALLRQRLRLLHAWCAFREAQARGDYEYMCSIEQQMQQLAQEDEPTWQLIPLGISFLFRCMVRREGALLVPGLLDAKRQASRMGNRFVLFKIMHALALALLDAGQLRLAYQECLSGLDLLKQSTASAQVAWHFSVSLAIALYQWNRLEEARSVLRQMIHDAATWQQSDVQAWGYHGLLMVELAAGELAAAQQTLQAGEHLAQRQGGAFQPSWLTEMRVCWWLAQGNVSEASNWAAQVVFPQDVWDPHSYEACLLLIRLLLAQQQWTQAVEALERFSSHLDRPGNRFITISFLSLYVVALHQAGKREQAHAVAVRLCALTEPEGYLRVYLDVGRPMQQTLQSLLTTSPDHTERTSALSRSSIARLLAAFAQEEQRRAGRAEAQPARPPAVAPLISPRLSGAASSVPALLEPLTPQEQRVLQLLAKGASNQQIATQLVIQLVTVKKHITNLLSKLGAANRTQALVRAREYSLL